MIPIPVPADARMDRPKADLVVMHPPPGVSDEDCGTAEMLIDAPSVPALGMEQCAYFRPSAEEIDVLRDGGYLELVQCGNSVHPFALNVRAVG